VLRELEEAAGVVGEHQMMCWKGNLMKTQAQLDAIIRKVKGTAAVEEMFFEDSQIQRYKLSNGGLLTINKKTGRGRISFLTGQKNVEF
jgi:hypothetical protein